MDIHQLRIFYTVAVNGGFSKAASQLYIAQPTITKNIQALENDLGIRLIERSSKRFELTEEGHRVKVLAEEILKKFDDMTRELYDLSKANTGDITLAGPPLSIAIYFPKFLKLVKEKYPGVNISLSECGSKTSVDMVCDGAADIGISQMPVLCQDVDIYPIIRDRCILLVNEEHPLADEESVSVASLGKEKFISLSSGFAMHDTVQNICNRAGFSPNIVFQTSLVSFAEKLVSLNEGISILPRPLVGLYPSKGVKIVELDEYIPWDIALIISNKRYRSGAAMKVLELALEHFRTSNIAQHYKTQETE